jgi:hypothetical protein
MPLDMKTIAARFAWTGTPEFDSSVVDETARAYVALKILEPAGPAEFITCPCGDSHMATVERILTKDRRTVFLAFCEETGIPYPVELEQLRRWRVNANAIMNRIQLGFGCSGKPESRGADLWCLGETNKAFAGCRRYVYFATRLSPKVLTLLPEGTTQILIVGELNPPETDKYPGRIFRMSELMSVQNGECVLDLDAVQRRLEDIKPAEGEKAPVIPKDAVKKSREQLILDFLSDRVMTLRNAYWYAVDHDQAYKHPRRPTYQEIADHIKYITNGAQTPVASTVMHTITDSRRPDLRTLWKGITDITFVRDYRRAKKQESKPKAQTDEEFIDEMFSQVGMEQKDDGYHVV